MNTDNKQRIQESEDRIQKKALFCFLCSEFSLLSSAFWILLGLLSPLHSSLCHATPPTCVISDVYPTDTHYDQWPIWFNCTSSTLNSGTWDQATIRWTFRHSTPQSLGGNLAPFGVKFTLENSQMGVLSTYRPLSPGKLTVTLDIWQSNGEHGSATGTFNIAAWSPMYLYIADAARGGSNSNDGLSPATPKLFQFANWKAALSGNDRWLHIKSGSVLHAEESAFYAWNAPNRHHQMVTQYGGTGGYTFNCVSGNASTAPLLEFAAAGLKYITIEGLNFVQTEAKPVVLPPGAITRKGTICTVAGVKHGFPPSAAYSVHVTGANEKDYNGVWGITYGGPNSFSFGLTDGSTPASPATGSITVALCRNRSCFRLNTLGAFTLSNISIINCSADGMQTFVTTATRANVPDGMYQWGNVARNYNSYGTFYVGKNLCVYNCDYNGSDKESVFRVLCTYGSYGGNRFDYGHGFASPWGGKNSLRLRSGNHQRAFSNQLLHGTVTFAGENTGTTPNEAAYDVLESNYITGGAIYCVAVGGPTSANTVVAHDLTIRNNVIDQNFHVESHGFEIEVPDGRTGLFGGAFTAGPGEVAANGTTITVSHPGHGFATGDPVQISGAMPAQYDNFFRITVVDADHFTCTAVNAPGVSPATGNIVIRKTISGDVKNVRILNNTFITGPGNQQWFTNQQNAAIGIVVKNNIIISTGAARNGWLNLLNISNHVFDNNRWAGGGESQIYARVNGINESWANWTRHAEVTNEKREAAMQKSDFVSPTYRPNVGLFTTLSGLPPTTAVYLDALLNPRSLRTVYAGAVDAVP